MTDVTAGPHGPALTGTDDEALAQALRNLRLERFKPSAESAVDQLNGLCDGPHPKRDLDRLQYDNQNTAIRKFIKRNGSINHELVCLTSGCRFVSPPIPINVAKLLLWAGLPVLEDRYSSKQSDVCSYKTCTSTEVEWHHFAPRNTFRDADNYPVMPLCREHHRAWHLTMDGYQWRRRVSA